MDRVITASTQGGEGSHGAAQGAGRALNITNFFVKYWRNRMQWPAGLIVGSRRRKLPEGRTT